MLNPRLKVTIKNTILGELFNKEKAAIQDEIDKILDLLTAVDIGNFYRYKDKEYSRASTMHAIRNLPLPSHLFPQAEEIHVLRLHQKAAHRTISNYIITSLNICSNIAECKNIFPNCIQHMLRDIPNSYLDNEEKSQEKILAYRTENKHMEDFIAIQYAKNILL